jgi:ribosomal protein S18 acetylase RimI-like enzyme
MTTHPASGTDSDSEPSGSVLARLEAYYDAVPRTAARAETVGPLTLFVADGPGWPYYARPRLGAAAVGAEDVAAMRRLQRALGVPEAFEWVAETTPDLKPAAEAAGLAVAELPLMVLAADDARSVPPPEGVELRLVTPEDDLAPVTAVAQVAFSAPGTAVGAAGPDALAGLAAELPPQRLAFMRDRLATGRTVTVVARLGGQPVAVGSHQPVGAVTEVVGVATLPAMRRRGLGAAVTSLLVQDAGARGITTVFLSAGDVAVARVYARLGFRRVGTACIAEPAGTGDGHPLAREPAQAPRRRLARQPDRPLAQRIWP